MVKKLELAVSLGFTSNPQHSPPTALSPLRSPILHTKRNLIIKGRGKEVLMPLATQKVVGTQSIRTRERLGGLLKFYYREAA